MLRRFYIGILLLGRSALAGPDAPTEPKLREPQLTSISPLGGRQGTAFQVQVRGKALAGASGAWFPCNDITARVENIDEIAPQPRERKESKGTPSGKTPREPEYRVLLSVQINPRATLGFHALRLITPLGLSNALPLEVVSEPVFAEQREPHGSAMNAQPLRWPASVNGTIEKKGETDFYAFDVLSGQELFFDAASDFKMDVSYRAQVELLLYEQTGSWFDPNRATLLPVEGPALSWEPVNPLTRVDFAAGFVLFPGLRHRFARSGRYFISVAAFEGRGGPDFAYQLRIASTRGTLGLPAHPNPDSWAERDSATMRQFGAFTRPLGPDRFLELASRTVMESDERKPPIPDIREQEPNDRSAQAQDISVPAILEGAIDRPGDLDLFEIKVQAGERLAFEIETPAAHPPRFNPWLKIRDSEGREVVSNIYKEYGGDGIEINKTLERKTIYTFERGGKYVLEIRDLTARQGMQDFTYRVLIRPQIPHIGRIEVSLGIEAQGSQIVDLTDRINIRPGESRKLTVLCEKEEGFDGDAGVAITNLPAGIDALPSSPASWVEPLLRGMQYRPLGIEPMSPEHHRPRREVTTILLLAREDAPVMKQPQM